MRSVLDRMGATPDERFATYLVAYSESRCFNDRKQKMQDGIHFSEGMFQQSDRWWPTPKDIEVATKSFLKAYRDRDIASFNMPPVEQVWFVQMWAATNPLTSVADFYKSRETQNYVTCLPWIERIMADPEFFVHNKKREP